VIKQTNSLIVLTANAKFHLTCHKNARTVLMQVKGFRKRLTRLNVRISYRVSKYTVSVTTLRCSWAQIRMFTNILI